MIIKWRGRINGFNYSEVTYLASKIDAFGSVFLMPLSSLKKILMSTLSKESNIGLHYSIEKHKHDRFYYEINRIMFMKMILSSEIQ